MRTDSSRRDHARDNDSGVTLVEIMVSVVLMGVLLAALLTAVQMSVRSSSIAYTGAQVETVLLNASDKINRARQVCNYENYVDAAAIAEGWDTSTTSVVVERLAANTGGPGDWKPQACPDDVSAFEVQRLTITATDPSGRITRTLTVVKSDVK